jgi:hypothetical protein
VNEAFADLITSQVAGGTNYASPAVSFPATGGTSYRDAAKRNCIEANVNNAITPVRFLTGSFITSAYSSTRSTRQGPLATLRRTETRGLGRWASSSSQRFLREANVFAGLSDTMINHGCRSQTAPSGGG